MRPIKNNKVITPWYRVGMVWFAIALPLMVIAASMATFVIAYQNSPVIITSDER